MSLYSILAMYEADLEKMQTALAQLDALISQVDGLKSNTMDTIAVNDKPYSENLINNSLSHLVKAKEYLSGKFKLLQ